MRLLIRTVLQLVTPIASRCLLGVTLLTLLSSCGEDRAPAEATSASTVQCAAVSSGEAWTPNVPGVSTANRGTAGITVSKTVYTSSSVLLTGMRQGYVDNGAHVAAIGSIDLNQDLGDGGSFSLVAEVENFPAELSRAGYRVWPALVSLSMNGASASDAHKEWIGMQGCTAAGFDDCTIASDGSYSCEPRSGCGPAPDYTPSPGPSPTHSPTAYFGPTLAERRDKWEQRQRLWEDGGSSVNVFPTCNWTATGGLACPFNSTFFETGTHKLRTGTFTAKYVLLTDFLENPQDAYQATLKLTVVKKQKSSGSPSGAIDLNVILVGNANVTESRTARGHQNLNALFRHVTEHLGQSASNIKIGKIDVYEWGCDKGGDEYASADVNYTGEMFAAGSRLVKADSEGKALNLFLVSEIGYGSLGTILGKSGGIVGSPINGTRSSGLAFSTLDGLTSYNADCTGDPDDSLDSGCPIAHQDAEFIDMGSTISHEIGHFLGLNHLSEKSGVSHDMVADTPECTRTYDGRVTRSSCRTDTACAAQWTGTCGGAQFCATAAACQFNHVMWWTAKAYGANGLGDGNIFSANSGSVMNYSPYVQ